MRVIAGSAGGIPLSCPRWDGVRPTMDQVRAAVFSSLAERVPDARVLDLFAGTGGLGIEALSRGARGATFVERDRRAVECIRQNLAATRLSAQAGGGLSGRGDFHRKEFRRRPGVRTVRFDFRGPAVHDWRTAGRLRRTTAYQPGTVQCACPGWPVRARKIPAPSSAARNKWLVARQAETLRHHGGRFSAACVGFGARR